MVDLKFFYSNKKVLVTGHTGFKGAWLCEILLLLGADVYGFALEPPTKPSLFEILDLDQRMHSQIGDVTNLEKLRKYFAETEPEIVIHMAAQPIVRESYLNPVATFNTNVMGTVNVLECVRSFDSVKSVVNVTTDKVYMNEELNIPFKEDDKLCGSDPYSNSKSCSELVTFSYIKSFYDNFTERTVSVSTCRAGNVIGGCDFAKDRIIPDCFRATQTNESVLIRNPGSVRPFQHVLEPLIAYLLIAASQYDNNKFSGNYNIGPQLTDCITAGEVADMFCKCWNSNLHKSDNKAAWSFKSDGGPREAGYLKLDCSLIGDCFGWKPKFHVDEAISKTVDVYKYYADGLNVREIVDEQIYEYIKKEA